MKLTPWRWGAGALIAAIGLLVACDGSNLFDPTQNPLSAPRVALSVPDAASAGDTLVIGLSASAANDVASITVAVRGATAKDTTIAVTAARTVNTSLKIAVPTILTDTLLYIGAVATDAAGNVSKARADTTVVLGPPAILGVTGADSLRAGTDATFRIHAFGSRKIAQFDITFRGAVNKDTTVLVTQSANDVTQDVMLHLPTVVSDTSLRVGIVAKDVSGLSGPATVLVAPLAVSGPAASLSAPIPTVAYPGANLDLVVHATAMRGVSKVGVVLTSAMTKDTSVTIVPAQTDVTQPISIRVPGDVTGSTIGVAVYAIDAGGTRSVLSSTTNVTVASGVPVITSITGPDSVRAGQPVDVRVVATGTRPIKQLIIRARGATTDSQSVTISPTATSVTKDFTITVPLDVADTILTITAVAIDEANQLSALTSASTKRVRVTDVTAPTVSATPNKGTTAAGSSFAIRIAAHDNVALRQVGYAVLNPAGDTIGTTPTLSNTSGSSKDTTFTFNVPSTLTPRTVRVLGIAVDASGRRGYSAAASVVVADSAAPAITINAPALNSTLPLNDSVRVSVHVVDPTGVQSISLKGQSTRVDSLGPTRVIDRFAEKTITFPFVPGAPLPRDTTIVRYLQAIPDSISEPVKIIVTAKDSLNNTASATTTILVGGPRVELRNPVANTQVVPGGTLLLTAYALDRSAGIDSVRIDITGAQNASYTFRPGCAPATCQPNGLTSNDSVVVNQNYTVGLATGTINISTTAWNRNRIAGTTTPVPVLVTSNAVTDATPPQVRVSMTANDRVELSDTITVTVAAQDVGAAGLRRMGVVVIAQPGGAIAPDTLYRDSLFSGSGRTGLQPATFKFTLAQFGFTEQNLVRLPRTITLSVHAFARDTVGNCGANVTNTLATIACDSVQVTPAPTASGQTWWYFAKNTSALTTLVTAVPGFARPLPSGSSIADLLVDNNPARPRMYLSNQALNRVEVLNLQDSTFTSSVSVGSEPWGLFLNNAAAGLSAGTPRLMVANSGGTNISMVDITQPVNSIAEVPAERILTPNAVLFDVATAVTNGLTRYTVTPHDFSDRPQFVAQDANDIILYSTKPTGAAPDGTVRVLTTDAPRRESKILFNRDAINSAGEGVAIAHIDSIVVERNSVSDDRIQLYDHVPGNPAAIIASGYTDLRTAINALKLGGSDIADFGGTWKIDAVGLSDTTYITTSGDRQYVGFGEGGVGPYAQVWIWQAATQGVSDNISVADLVGNASETVLGIALNSDGKMGAARGSSATSFFTNDAASEGQLRLQGRFSNGVAGGNGGVALHPSHNTALQSTSTTLAFIATVNRSIKIVDTFSFRERGEIQIRDNIVGPLRAALPLPAENVGLTGTCDEIWVKLYGVTGAGKAVIINVRVKDILVDTPNALVCPS